MYLPDYLRVFREGVTTVDLILAFLVSVAAGLFVELICVWFGGDDN